MNKEEKAALLLVATAFAKHQKFLEGQIGKVTDLQNVIAAAKLRYEVLEAIQIKMGAK